MNGPINKGVSSALPMVFSRRSDCENRRGEGPWEEFVLFPPPPDFRAARMWQNERERLLRRLLESRKLAENIH